LKKIFIYIPEMALLLLSCFYWLHDAVAHGFANYPVIIFSVLLAALLIWKNKILAVFFSLLLGSISLFMLVAVFFEYSEFPDGDSEGMILLVTGYLIFLLLGATSLYIPFKYFRK